MPRAGMVSLSPHGYRKAGGHSPAATQILQARWSSETHFEHLLHLEGAWRLLRCGHMAADAGAFEGRWGGKGMFSCRQKGKVES